MYYIIVYLEAKFYYIIVYLEAHNKEIIIFKTLFYFMY